MKLPHIASATLILVAALALGNWHEGPRAAAGDPPARVTTSGPIRAERVRTLVLKGPPVELKGPARVFGVTPSRRSDVLIYTNFTGKRVTEETSAIRAVLLFGGERETPWTGQSLLVASDHSIRFETARGGEAGAGGALVYYERLD